MRPPRVTTRKRPAETAGAPTVICLFCGRLLANLRDVHIVEIDARDHAAAIACERCHALLLPAPAGNDLPPGHA